MSRSALILASVLVGGLAVPASAQTSVVEGQVPFDFTVGSTPLPAGHYRVTLESPESGSVSVENLDTGEATIVEYVTRMGSREKHESVLVFDVVGSQPILSEVHVADADGYLLAGAAEKEHTHTQVKVTLAVDARP